MKKTAAAPLSENAPEKLLLFPDKLKAILESRLRKEGGFRPDPRFPISVELSLTHLCDLDCVYCSDRRVRRSPDLLTPAVLKKLIGDLKEGGVRGLVIEGGGEPTLSPLFPEAVETASGLSLPLGLITNGLKLFAADRDASLYRRFQWIRVSLDAASEESFHRLKGRKGFHRTLENIARLARLEPRPVVGAGYVLTRLNSDPEELLRLAQTLREMGGVSYLAVRPVVDHPDLSYRPPEGALGAEESLARLKSLETPDFLVDLAPLSLNKVRGNLGLPCLAHSLAAVVGADGLVWICGRLNAQDDFRPLGSLLEESFGEIWEGGKRREQAALLSSAAYCRKNCPDCRMTKFNLLLSRVLALRTPDFI
ncbi:MAG: radical SAM protein [Deltaproteobacteria bacterium]|jgi:MoaA/NifB/PqqE/SkfB family radical SAM enzyme|nr:radical SAM protein [Deltaproteobacteria bacterium]